MMLGELDGNIDVIVPRGGKIWSGACKEARVPVCRLEAFAMSMCMVMPPSTWRARLSPMPSAPAFAAQPNPLVDKACAASHLAPIVDLLDAGCEVRGCAKHIAMAKYAAADDDWGQFLGPVIAVRVVDGLDEAVTHIARFGSNHTDAIITADAHAASRFLNGVDSAIVMPRYQQFADGSEFGMETEIGIATGRFRARTCRFGAIDQLQICRKWRRTGAAQIMTARHHFAQGGHRSVR